MGKGFVFRGLRVWGLGFKSLGVWGFRLRG